MPAPYTQLGTSGTPMRRYGSFAKTPVAVVTILQICITNLAAAFPSINGVAAAMPSISAISASQPTVSGVSRLEC